MYIKFRSYEISIIRCFIIFVSSLLLLFNLLTENYFSFFNVITAFYVVIISIYLAFISRKNVIVFVVFTFIAYCNYSIFWGRYINPDISPINRILVSEYIDGIGINILLLFMTVVLLLVNEKNLRVDFKDSLTSNNPYNPLISWGAFIIIILIAVLFYHPSSTGERAGYSPIYEYSTIFFIIGFYFSGEKNKFVSKALIFLLLIYVFRDFYGGHRVTGLQLTIILFVYFFSNKINYRKILVYGFSGLIILNLVAMYRGSFTLESISFVDSFNNLTDKMFAFDTAYFAYLASLTFVDITPRFTEIERMGNFKDFILSQFVIGTVGESLYTISKKFYQHSNGGILAYYFFYYLKWIGVVLSGAFISMYVNLIASVKKDSKGMKKVIIIYVVSTVPRWYLYSPSQLIRGVMLLIAVYIISNLLISITTKNKQFFKN